MRAASTAPRRVSEGALERRPVMYRVTVRDDHALKRQFEQVT
jgi:hypothetical protein